MRTTRFSIASLLVTALLAGGVGNAAPPRNAPFDQGTHCAINKANVATGTYCISDPSPTLALGAPFLPARAGLLSVGGHQVVIGYPLPHVTLSSVSNFSVSGGAFNVQAEIKPVAVVASNFSLCLQVQESVSGGPFTAVGTTDCIRGNDLYFRQLSVSGTSTAGAVLKSTVTLTLPDNSGLPSSLGGAAIVQVQSISS